MTLPYPPPQYNQGDQAKARTQIERQDRQNRKKGQDVEIARTERLILPDLITGDRYSLTIESGAIVLALIP